MKTTRREFLKKALVVTGGVAVASVVPGALLAKPKEPDIPTITTFERGKIYIFPEATNTAPPMEVTSTASCSSRFDEDMMRRLSKTFLEEFEKAQVRVKV